MKLREIIGNQVIRIYRAPEQSLAPDNVKALDLVRSFEGRYGFFQGPRTVAEFNTQSGITFLRGQFRQGWFIDKFQLFPQGALVEAKVPTKEIEAFLDDASEWVREKFHLEEAAITPISRFYLSQVEVEVDVALGRELAQFDSVGKQVAEMLRSYGQPVLDFEVADITLRPDAYKIPGAQPGAAFMFMRRDKQPFESRLYFSSAPLSTPDHMLVLNKLESILKSKKTTAS